MYGITTRTTFTTDGLAVAAGTEVRIVSDRPGTRYVKVSLPGRLGWVRILRAAVTAA